MNRSSTRACSVPTLRVIDRPDRGKRTRESVLEKAQERVEEECPWRPRKDYASFPHPEEDQGGYE